MNVDSVPGLVVFAVVATVSPGGSTTLATVSGAHFGVRRSVPVLAGITVALAVMAAGAAAGLGSLLLAAPALTEALKVAGTVYLLLLAVRTARSGAPRPAGAASGPMRFRTGAWLLLSNPKGWAMTVAAAASFTAAATDPAVLAGVFGATFAVAAAGSLALWCVLGVVLARVLRTARQWAVVNGALAALLVASAVPIWLEA